MSKTLVTGASGFVGRAVVAALLAQGREVRVVVRSPGSRALQGLDVEIVRGDLTEPASLSAALPGCSRLFHVAADYRLWVPDPAAMYATNVAGTRSLLQAAFDAGLERVVYTSTVGALGNPGDGTPGTEETPVSLADMVGHYKKSKFLAEQVALEFAGLGLPLVVVNPSTPVGSWDVRPTPTGQMIVDFLRGKMPAFLDSGLNLIHVGDVAQGHLLAESRGRVGEKYILGHQNLTLADIFATLAQISGVKAPRWRLPYYPILGLAYLNEFWSTWITRRPPMIPLTAVKMAKKFMFFDSHKAVRELGLPQTPVAQALQEAVDWFRQQGYIKEK
jgi:dihydroflavonol-4-reductase